MALPAEQTQPLIPLAQIKRDYSAGDALDVYMEAFPDEADLLRSYILDHGVDAVYQRACGNGLWRTARAGGQASASAGAAGRADTIATRADSATAIDYTGNRPDSYPTNSCGAGIAPD
jgi:hypothetical protein